jgi:tryptophan halogenase
MSETTIRSVVIMGGGTAGWMAAAALSRLLAVPGAQGLSPSITLVESDEIGTVGVGEASVPLMAQFNAALGIDEHAFLAACHGTYKLGIEFAEWGRPGSSYFHGFGDYGAPIDGVAAHHAWVALRAQGDDAPIADYSLPWAAARRGKFAPPAGGAAYAYAYHFDAGLYARFLRRLAEAAGVVRIEGRVDAVIRDEQSGDLTALRLAGGQMVHGDLFVDCSGFSGLLIAGALGVGFEDWSHWLPCDRAVVAPGPCDGPPPSHTRSTAREAGWQWRIPLQHREGNGYVYASAFTSEQRAADLLLDSLPAGALADPRLIRFTAGHRKALWSHNCVAIGLAGGFLEPLESTSIQLIQTSIARLIEFFPARGIDPAVRAEFNRLTANEYAGIRDFIILHYASAQREGALWDYVRNMALPDSLQHKIELWRAMGRVPMVTEESYGEPSWAAIFLGNGIVPRQWDARIDQLPLARLAAGLRARREAVARAADALPLHRAYIDRHCASGVSV